MPLPQNIPEANSFLVCGPFTGSSAADFPSTPFGGPFASKGAGDLPPLDPPGINDPLDPVSDRVDMYRDDPQVLFDDISANAKLADEIINVLPLWVIEKAALAALDEKECQALTASIARSLIE